MLVTPFMKQCALLFGELFDKNTNFSIADDRHLHNFVYKFVSKLIKLNDTNQNKIWIPNAIAGASCCALPAITGIVAIIFQSQYAYTCIMSFCYTHLI